MEKRPKILVVCGEASGDHHASSLVRAIKAIEPGAVFFGAGGPQLKAEGVELVYDLTSIAVVGFFEVLKHLSTFKKVFRDLLEKARAEKPDAAILIDYPGFNMALAKELKKMGIPVIYYISPQIWAWGKNRIKAIKRDMSTMLVILPFEKKLYDDAGVPCEFVGHPSLDSVKPSAGREEFLRSAGLDPAKMTIGLLPGSREKEVKSLLPDMLKACAIIDPYMPLQSLQFVLLASPSVRPELFKKLCAKAGVDVKIVTGRAYDGIAASDFCMVCSGTATLETGILGTPMVILYRVHWLTWLYVRLLIRIPFIGLVNIVKGRKAMPELLQFDCTPLAIADEALKALKNPDVMKKMRQELADVREKLGQAGASERAAKQVVEFVREQK